MIKLDIANALMQAHPCSRSTALQAVDLLTERMKQALLDGDRIEIRGFGVFEPRPRKRGMGRNIKTGDSVAIPKGAEGVDPKWQGIGIRIEDDILVTKEGPKNLSARLPRKAEDVERALK